MSDLLIDICLYVTYAMFGVALVSLIYFSLKQFISNFGQSKTALYGIGAMIVLFVLAYVLSSGTDLSQALLEKTKTTVDTSRMVGAGLIYTYLLFGGLVVTLLTVEIMKPFKK